MNDKTYCAGQLLCKNGFNCNKVITKELLNSSKRIKCVSCVDQPCFVRFFENGHKGVEGVL